jgi:hypothetical protein
LVAELAVRVLVLPLLGLVQLQRLARQLQVRQQQPVRLAQMVSQQPFS